VIHTHPASRSILYPLTQTLWLYKTGGLHN